MLAGPFNELRGGVAMKGRSMGVILLAIYLILVSVMSLFGLFFQGSGVITGAVALCAGIALLAGR
jgi:hypothetical protein